MATTDEQLSKAIVPAGVALAVFFVVVLALSVLVGITCF